MKGFIHSKRFRQNLYKWLGMYIGALLIFTTAVTYSKYMTSLTNTDQTGVANFNVEITNVTNCKEGTATEDNPNTDTNAIDKINICKTGSHRVTDNIDYYFSVSSEFDVYTLLVLTLDVHEKFDIISIQDADYPNKTVSYNTTGVKTKITDYIEAGSKTTTKYKVTLKLKEEYKGSIEEEIISNMIQVGYTATQFAENHATAK